MAKEKYIISQNIWRDAGSQESHKLAVTRNTAVLLWWRDKENNNKTSVNILYLQF